MSQTKERQESSKSNTKTNWNYFECGFIYKQMLKASWKYGEGPVFLFILFPFYNWISSPEDDDDDDDDDSNNNNNNCILECELQESRDHACVLTLGMPSTGQLV